MDSASWLAVASAFISRRSRTFIFIFVLWSLLQVLPSFLPSVRPSFLPTVLHLLHSFYSPHLVPSLPPFCLLPSLLSVDVRLCCLLAALLPPIRQFFHTFTFLRSMQRWKAMNARAIAYFNERLHNSSDRVVEVDARLRKLADKIISALPDEAVACFPETLDVCLSGGGFRNSYSAGLGIALETLAKKRGKGVVKRWSGASAGSQVELQLPVQLSLSFFHPQFLLFFSLPFPLLPPFFPDPPPPPPRLPSFLPFFLSGRLQLPDQLVFRHATVGLCGAGNGGEIPVDAPVPNVEPILAGFGERTSLARTRHNVHCTYPHI
jgi:hypothetical protein